MMNKVHECISVEAIGDVLTMSPADAWRQGIEECPRCRALLRSYAEFMRAEPETEAGLQGARDQLGHFLSSLAGSAERSRVRARPARVSFWSVWFRPARLLPVAALIVVVAGFLMRGRDVEVSGLRSAGSGTEAGVFAPLDPVPNEMNSSVLLQWSAHPDADGYEVRLYGAALEILQTVPTRETFVVLNRDALSETALSGTVITWRVRALRRGDIVAETEPRSATLP